MTIKTKNNKKNRFLFPLIFAVTVFACLLFMMISACIPQELIESHGKETAEYFYEEPLFDIVADELQNFKKDNYADCITAGIAYHMHGENPYTAVIRADYNREPFENVNESFYDEVQGEKVAKEDYSRYWHGSAAVVRILYLFMSIKEMRYAMVLTGLVMNLAAVITLVRKRQAAAGIIYAISFLAVNGVFALECMEYAFIFLLLPVSIFAITDKRIYTDETKAQLTFMVIGMLTAFFDFLTTETLTFTVPFVIYYILLQSDRQDSKIKQIRIKDDIILMFRHGIVWGIGYLGMFLIKWMLATVTLGKDALMTAVDSAMERVNGEVSLTLEMAGEKANLLQRIQGILVRNFGCLYWSNGEIKSGAVVGISICVLALIALFLYLARKESEDRNKWVVLMLVGSVPFIRFMILSNHAYVHYFFTYRCLMTTVFVILYLIYDTTLLSQRCKRIKGGKR